MSEVERKRDIRKYVNCTYCHVEGLFIRGAVMKLGLFQCRFCAMRNHQDICYWVDQYFDENGNYLKKSL